MKYKEGHVDLGSNDLVDNASAGSTVTITALSDNHTPGIHFGDGSGNAGLYGNERAVLSGSPPVDLDTSPLNANAITQLDTIDPYFDYTSFSRPWDYNIDHAVDFSNWFSAQFFDAVRETELAYSPPVQNWYSSAPEHMQLNDAEAHTRFSSMDQYASNPHAPTHCEPRAAKNHIDADKDGTDDSRAPSPPNERSLEDRTPFAWDPRSKPIARAKPIILSADDPLLATVDEHLTLSEVTRGKVRDFLQSRVAQIQSDDSFTLPSLSVVNVFITLYFKYFLPKAPILHVKTIDINALPPALLSIILVIGSTYSRLRYTRRFGIVLFDRIRRNLQHEIEADNNLMRDPLHIYAVSLVLFMGLWCGNKRAFELAEALQAVMVTYVRHLPDDDHHDVARQAFRSPMPRDHALQSKWRTWIRSESIKRLRWFVYALDSQFSSLLGLNSLLTTADVRKWEMPCDEDFWMAPTPRSWKNLLGSSPQPSCPIFGPVAAFVLSPPSLINEANDHIALPRLNDWSSSLVLSCIMAQVSQFQQSLVMTRMFQGDAYEWESSPPTSQQKSNLQQSLQRWHDTYVRDSSTRQGPTFSSYFLDGSIIQYYLARIYTGLPLADIQDCIGKHGPMDATAAMDHLQDWCENCSTEACLVVEAAAACITYIMTRDLDIAPYDIIAQFLCHLALWIFAIAAPISAQDTMIKRLQVMPQVSDEVRAFIKAGFVKIPAESREIPHGGEPQLILRHAIQVLAKLGTWGASSNLALLLHLHPGVVRDVSR